jgi:leucyl aminopeptidase
MELLMSNTVVVNESANVNPVNIVWFNSNAVESGPFLSAEDVEWLNQVDPSIKSGAFYLRRDHAGLLQSVYFALDDRSDGRAVAALANQLPAGQYRFVNTQDWSDAEWMQICIAWIRASYAFKRYKSSTDEVDTVSILSVPDNVDVNFLQHWQSVSFEAKDLINTPAEDLTPQHWINRCSTWAESNAVVVSVVEGDDLLAENYPTVHRVGRGSHNPPALIDMRWGNENDMKITLVGKGVCFDTGGLNIKPTNGMRYMKKDMGGAAMAFALAQMIVLQKLPICLRVLIPAVDNIITSNSMLPGDVVTTRSGKTVEITNTDAEGRLILCDALTAAAEDEPDYIIDFATLTGAARVALGPSITALFSNDGSVAQQLQHISWDVNDKVWALPLYHEYLDFMQSDVADIMNSSSTYFAGTITAALYLREFVPASVKWIHLDAFCWNHKTSPGYAAGGEVQAVRAVFNYITKQLEGAS